MTSRRGGHPFAVAAWILFGAVVVASVVGVLGGILSRSYVVDMAAMWPLLAGALLLGLLGRRMGRRSARSPAILPLTLFTAVVLAASLHLGGWDPLPSASARLTGPGVEELSDPTELVVQVIGELVIGPGDGSAYAVSPIQRGGQVGVPQATETSVDGAVSVRIEAAPDAPSWYTFAGWEVALSPGVSWRLVLNGRIDADLSSLVIDSGAVAGSGTVRLGEPSEGGASVIFAGNFQIIVPPDAAVVVDGEASVPADWTRTDGRARSPSAGSDGADAWRLSIQGDVPVMIREG